MLVGARRLVLLMAFLGLVGNASPCSAEAGARAAVERAMEQLASPDATVRAAAAAVLAKHYPEGACGVPLIEVALSDEAEGVRAAATAALRTLGAAGAEDLVAFLADVQHPQNRAFDKARRYIAETGARSTPWDLAEIEGLEARAARCCLTPPERDPSIERSVRHVLRELLAGDAGTFEREGDGLRPLPVRRLACASLAVNGLRALPASATPNPTEKLLTLATHADDSVRWGAIQLIAILRSENPKAQATLAAGRPERKAPDVDTLIRKLPDPRGRIYPITLSFLDRTLRDLFELGAKARAAVPRLKAILAKVRQDKGVEVQGEEYHLISALCRIDGPTPARIQAILEGLEMTKAGDEYVHPRSEHAVRALGTCAHLIEEKQDAVRIGRAAAVLLAQGSSRLQPAILEMLEPLGKGARPASDALVTLLIAMEKTLAASLAKVRNETEPGTHVGRFEVFLADLDSFYRVASQRHRVARLLAGIRPIPPATAARLRKLLGSADPWLRSEIAQVLR